MDVVIREWKSDDNIESLTNMIHKAYAKWKIQEIHFVGSHQSTQITEDRMRDGLTFVAEVHGEVVGTITVYPPGQMTGCEYYAKQKPTVFGQFAVDTAFQDQGIGYQLLEKAIEVARNYGSAEIACDTSSEATELIEMYQNWGFHRVGFADWRPTVNYESVILAREV